MEFCGEIAWNNEDIIYWKFHLIYCLFNVESLYCLRKVNTVHPLTRHKSRQTHWTDKSSTINIMNATFKHFISVSPFFSDSSSRSFLIYSRSSTSDSFESFSINILGSVWSLSGISQLHVFMRYSASISHKDCHFG